MKRTAPPRRKSPLRKISAKRKAAQASSDRSKRKLFTGPKKVNAKRKAKAFAAAYHSKERVAFVQAMRCCVCLSPHGSDNAHTETGGMGLKAAYTTIVPLCRKHHQEYDRRENIFGMAITRAAIASCASVVEAAWQAHLSRSAA